MPVQITTLIPAYKPQYLSEQLRALQVQTVRPTRIVFSDDSPDGAFQRMLAEPHVAPLVQQMNIEVIPGPRRGAWANCLQLLDHYGGSTPLFHLLMDDDIPYPSFYARHRQAHAEVGCRAVVSRRWYALENGQPVGDLPVPPELDQYPARRVALPRELLFPQIVGRCDNWLGEFSNVTLKADMLDVVRRPQLAGIHISGLQDIASLLVAALEQPLVYLNEHLGYFRTGPAQNSAQPQGRVFKQAVVGWAALAIAGRKLGLLSDELAQAAVRHTALRVVDHYTDAADMTPLRAGLQGLLAEQPGAEAAFLQAWAEFSE